MSTYTGGNCTLHGRYTGLICPACNSAGGGIPSSGGNANPNFTGYFTVVPQYRVEFTIPHRADIPARTETFSVSQDHLDAFIKILLANGISTFKVSSSSQFGTQTT